MKDNSYIKREQIDTMNAEEAKLHVGRLQAEVTKLRKERAALRHKLQEKQVVIRNLWDVIKKK